MTDGSPKQYVPARGKAGADLPHKHPVIWMQPVHPAKSGLTVGAPLGASAQAIISEIKTCASVFSETGEDACIDLRCLKAMPEEREILAGLLGEGEVSVIVDTGGRSDIRETAIPCVWWVRHRNCEGETVGELIEITAVPDLIVGDRSAVARGLKKLDAAPPSDVSGGS